MSTLLNKPWIFLLATLCFASCRPEQPTKTTRTIPPPELRIDNIERVFMHLPGDYSVMYKKNDVYHIERIKTWRYSSEDRIGVIPNWILDKVKENYGELQMDKVHWETILKADLPSETPMFMEIKFSSTDIPGFTAIIHLSSANEVSGGEWRTPAKFPMRQQTTVIR